MILVTGAAGIVGRAVCSALAASQIDFVPVVRRKQRLAGRQACVADLTHEDSLDRFSQLPITAVVHLAAAVPHSGNYPDSERSADMTRCMDRHLFSFSRSLNVPLIYISTCGLYDRSLKGVKFEDDARQIRIDSPYFSAKFQGERLFGAGREATILRLAAPVGPGLKPSVVVSRFIMAARANAPINLWGTGSREQNFIDTRDVADLVLKVLAKPLPCIINVAGSSPTTMSELANAVIEAVGAGAVRFSGKADPRDGETADYSIAKARDLYGWLPMHNLVDSCRLLLEEDFDHNI